MQLHNFTISNIEKNIRRLKESDYCKSRDRSKSQLIILQIVQREAK